MAKSKKKPLSKQPKKEEPKKSVSSTHEDEDELDFGGFPKNISLKRNMGCGG